MLLTATPATSQTTGNSTQPTTTTVNGQMQVDNAQTGTGDVSADDNLTVTENDGLTSATAQATGNALQGGNDAADATLNSVQNLPGSIRASAVITGANDGGDAATSQGTPVYANSQAIGNYLTSVSHAASLTANATQTATGAEQAWTGVIAPNNSIYTSGEGDATAEANHAGFEVTQGALTATMTQASTGDVSAKVTTAVDYSPSPNLYASYATGNYYGAYSGDQGSQDHTVTQSQTGATAARTEVYGGNMWQVESQSNSVANNVDVQNTGGALIVANDQTQSGPVSSQAYLRAEQYGQAYVTASGIGNQVAAGNNDIYVRLDNTQLSSGGVDATATFDGVESGYDAYVTADAVGNQALAYACSECQADYGVTSTQTNSSDVSATATAVVNQGRSIVSSARATGNSATYYVSK